MVSLLSFSCIHFFFYALVILLSSTAISGRRNETDHEALLKIKSLITQDPYGALTSWNNSLHFCDWSHVYCGKRHRRVTRIILSSQGLEGSLSPYVGNLSFLRALSLGNNSFQGAIPHEVNRLSRLRHLLLYQNKFNGVIPTNMSGCFNLERIGLSYNELVGSIPKEISSLSKLIFLSLFNNKLTGGIPAFLGNITSLELFSVTENPLGGSIPNTISHWKILREFYAKGCNLYGIIPLEFGLFSRLRFLYLANNKFSGVIPANISSCSNLKELDLSYNKLVGNIPNELSFLSKLTYISVDNNNLTGGIPSYSGNFTSLEVFSAKENPLGGTIPDTLGNLKSLKEIYFGGCNLYGTIPDSLYNLSLLANISLASNQLTGGLYPAIGGMLPNLVFFQLWGNQLSGPLPPSISNCTRLRLLELARNMFSGHLAIDFAKLRDIYTINLSDNLFGSIEADEMKFIDSMKNCTKLKRLAFGNCKFQGVLPRSIGNLSIQLNYLHLGKNQLHGNLPTSIGNLAGLKILSLGGNQFTGNIPSSIGNLQNLEGVYLYETQLSGQIPDSIGNLSLLLELHLYSNMLEGVIPSSLGNCHHLLALYLSDNKLNGKIPTPLLQLSSLSITLDLSQNNLFGSLPVEIGNLNMLTTLDLSDNNLSGNIPSSLSGCGSLLRLSLKGNLFQGMIPSSLSSLKGLLELDISCNNLSGHIPSFFERFKLEYLNLSYNDFEGEVPMAGVFANESAFFVLGNSRLCGGFVEIGLPKCKETKKYIKMVRLFVIVTLILFTFFIATCLAYVWRKKKRKSHLSQSSTSERFIKVSYDQLFKATNGFSESNLIGTGGFSSVYKGILYEDDDTFVAIKVLHLQNQGAQRSFTRECEAWRNIRHRNLLKIITSCSSVDSQGNLFKALVYEFMPNGSLHVIVHGDLKPSNILLDDDMVAHVGDFGLARFLESSYPNYSTEIQGTIGYIAPEYGLGSEMTSSADVYSFGILVLEVMTGKNPTDDIFSEDLCLHKFASMALPGHVIDIINVSIINIYQEDKFFVQNKEANAKIIEECLALTIKIGVSCSMESPTLRMDIKKVVHELQEILDTLENV